MTLDGPNGYLRLIVTPDKNRNSHYQLLALLAHEMRHSLEVFGSLRVDHADMRLQSNGKFEYQIDAGTESAYLAGMAGWLLLSRLTPAEQQAVARMVAATCAV